MLLIKSTQGVRASLSLALDPSCKTLFLLLMSILLESLLTLVRSYLMALSFLSAWHSFLLFVIL